jgi:hypothetical protein
MQIELNENYRIIGGRKQYILQEKSTVLEGDNKGNEYWTNEGYFKTLEALFTYYIDLRVRCSNTTTLKGLVRSVKELKKEVHELLEEARA